VEGYCITQPKPPRKPIPWLGYSIIKHHGSTLLDGYCSCSKLHNTLAIPLIRYPINTLGSITYIFKLGGVMELKCNTCMSMGYLNSPWNIKIFFKYLIPCQYIMKFMFSKLIIHFTIWFNIYTNELNAKLVTLMIHRFRV
jgi:hypothetical protein